MRPSARILALLACVASTAVAGSAPAHAQAHRFHADHVLGTSLDVAAVTSDPAAACAAAQAALAEIARLEPVLSGWRPDGALARLNRDAPAAAPSELVQLIAAAEGWRTVTRGAFDPRLGEVTAARRAADPLRLAHALQALDAARDRSVLEGAELRRPPGVAFDLDGVAKGYVVDRALAAAREAAPGLDGLMVDLGGDLRCVGRGPDGGAWRVGVGARGDGPPAVVLRVADRAIAASGAGERDIGGGSHLTASDGVPAGALAAAVVTAPCAADADALATALCLMPPHEGLALAERLPGVEARLVDAAGGVHVTRGWSALVEPAPRLLRAAAAVPAAAPEVTVSYEVPRIDAPKYYAPYIVIWVTDAERQLVRTVALLGEKPRYLESNYVWWRRYGRKIAGVDAQAKPTRPPGRYTATWDGRDEAGAAVAPGRYTVHVEAARQDGGHTYESLDVVLGAGGATVAAALAKDELGALKVTVGTRAGGRAQHVSQAAAARRGAGLDRGAFYRLARMLHAYLSAFAFLALIFFAATGLLLDHPDWLQGARPREREAGVRLSAADITAANRTRDPGRALAAVVGRRTPLLGAYKSAEMEDGSALIHLEGVRGTSDIDLDTATGEARVTVAPATAVSVLGELHRGRKSGAAWRWVIDVSAVVILALSVIGYVLFFSLRFRLRTSLLLTAASLLALVGVFVLLTP